jgi:hypothetical protein
MTLHYIYSNPHVSYLRAGFIVCSPLHIDAPIKISNTLDTHQMDIDGISSPPPIHSSLPPSSAPDPTPTSRPSNSNRPRSVADALAFGDDEGEDNEDQVGGRRRRRARGQVDGDVPLVRDAVGESVAESFETFLKTCAHFPSDVNAF